MNPTMHGIWQTPGPMVLSMATPNYHDAALGLIDDCNELQIPCTVESLPEMPRADACRQKPFVISGALVRQMQLGRTARPIWWIDADCAVRGLPHAIPDDRWMSLIDQYKTDYPVKSSVIFLRPCADSLEFLATWIAVLGARWEDHWPMVRAWKNVTDQPRLEKGIFYSGHNWVKIDERRPA